VEPRHEVAPNRCSSAQEISAWIEPAAYQDETLFTSRGEQAPAFLDSLRESFEHFLRSIPVNAAICDALTINQGLTSHQVLSTTDEVALNHHPQDTGITCLKLAGNVIADSWLVFRFFCCCWHGWRQS